MYLVCMPSITTGCALHPLAHPSSQILGWLPFSYPQLGIDYSKLRDHLGAGEWREAEDETRALLIRMAGPEAVKRGWVYFTEVSPRHWGLLRSMVKHLCARALYMCM